MNEEFTKRGFIIVNGYTKPLPFVFEDNVVVTPNESKDTMPTTHHLAGIEYHAYKGMHMYMTETDAKYPFIGSMPDPIDWFFLNQAKRLIVESLKFFKSGWFTLNFIFKWNKIKYLEKILASYNSVTLKGLEHLFLKDEYMTPIAYETKYFISTFLQNIGIRKEVAVESSKIVSVFIDYDNAYRWREMDIISETTEEKLIENPIKECKRLLAIWKKRDVPSIYNKGKFLEYAVYILLIPKYKKAFIKTIKEDMEIENIIRFINMI